MRKANHLETPSVGHVSSVAPSDTETRKLHIAPASQRTTLRNYYPVTADNHPGVAFFCERTDAQLFLAAAGMLEACKSALVQLYAYNVSAEHEFNAGLIKQLENAIANAERGQ